MNKNLSPAGGRLSTSIVPWLAGLSAASALIHAAVVQEHLAEFLLFGIAFVIMALFQAGWAFAVLGWGASRSALFVAVVVNAGIAGLWMLSRTRGLPIGPEPGTPEALGRVDVLATVYEVALVAGCICVLLGARFRPIRSRAIATALTAVTASGLTLLTFIAIAAGHAEGSGHGGHLLLLAAGVIAFAGWAALDVRANGRPPFSWRLRPDEPVRRAPERVPAC